MKIKDSLPLKIVLMGVLTLLLLIPLMMIRSQINERERTAAESRQEVSDSWGREQTLTGPVLMFTYNAERIDELNKGVTEERSGIVYPHALDYDIDLSTQMLHRSIYDVMVYGSDVTVTGDFIIPPGYADIDLTESSVSMGLSDLRGIDGSVEINLGGTTYTFHSNSGRMGTKSPGDTHRDYKGSLSEPIRLDRTLMDGYTSVPFRLTYHVRGSSSMRIKPFGETTTVKMHSNCQDPSFVGDLLPAERDVTDEGFTARWSVSEINRGNPDDTSFGVNLLQGVTQYQESMRSAKYGILVILLVFIAGLAVELVGKKKIDLVQYLVIGLSLVLFYALVLAFSEFMRFPLAYGLAALMTVSALFGYFRGILRDKTAWLLSALVGLAYLLNYILLHIETYAFLAGTLVLFGLLVGIMYLTRNLNQARGMEPED